MPVYIGGELLSTGEVPERLPGLGGTNRGGMVKMSDGTKIAVITGDDPGDLSIKGRIQHTDGNGDAPHTRMLRLDALRKAGNPVQFEVRPLVSYRPSIVETVVLWSVLWDLYKDMRVEYTILMSRQVGAVAGQHSRGSGGGSVSLAQLNVYAAAAGPGVQAAWVRARGQLGALIQAGH